MTRCGCVLVQQILMPAKKKGTAKLAAVREAAAAAMDDDSTATAAAPAAAAAVDTKSGSAMDTASASASGAASASGVVGSNGFGVVSMSTAAPKDATVVNKAKGGKVSRVVPRSKSVTGKLWKEPKDARASAMMKVKSLKTTFSKRQAAKEQALEARDKQRQIIDEIKEQKRVSHATARPHH